MWTLLNKVTKHWNLLTKYWRQPPLTLIHGDAHLGNVYFRDDGTAGFYDWQLVNANTPLCDVSYFLFFAVSPNDLKANEKRYLSYYKQQLVLYLQRKKNDGNDNNNDAVTDADVDILNGLTDERIWSLYASRAVWSLLACTVTAGIGDFVPDQELVKGFTAKVVEHVKRVNAIDEIDHILNLYGVGDGGKKKKA